MSIDIEATDVVRLIEQFLKENNLHRTLETLQDETSVTMNTVDNLQTFTQEIQRGRWDVVLKILVPLRLPTRHLVDIYEQIALELIEMREIAAARNLVRQTDPMQFLREKHPERYLHLEQLLTKTYIDPKDLYADGVSKEKRRQRIAQALAGEVTVAPPARLLTLIGQALKWQQYQGLLPPDGNYDLFCGVARAAKTESDQIPDTCYATIRFPRGKHAETVLFSPDGQYLVTGSADGYIEVWNHMTGKLRTDLKYQAEEKWMTMKDAVLSLAFSPDGQLLATGSESGQIKVWTIQDGRCVRRFPSAHTQAVASLCFNKAGSQILSGSFDHTIRLHGLKSGKTLKEYRGHSSFVNSVVFSTDMAKVYSGSSDGTVKVWDYKTCECQMTLSPQSRSAAGASVPASVTTAAIRQLVSIPHHPDQLVVCPQLPSAPIMTTEGRVIRSCQLPETADSSVDLVSVCLSPRGDYTYAVGEDAQLYCFETLSGNLAQTFKAKSA
ncbi:hypothetical protein H4R35_004650 [Dimargaris xerosporica]|nr:hypothetical protein H4R35_004650 [Dimargaris xerosporica]